MSFRAKRSVAAESPGNCGPSTRFRGKMAGMPFWTARSAPPPQEWRGMNAPSHFARNDKDEDKAA